jgi:hypothetical protein
VYCDLPFSLCAVVCVLSSVCVTHCDTIPATAGQMQGLAEKISELTLRMNYDWTRVGEGCGLDPWDARELWLRAQVVEG